MENDLSILPKTEFAMMDISLLELNEGQLDGLPANPREMTVEQHDLLKDKIERYPQYLKYNLPKVFPLDGGKYIVVDGNMRVRVLQELGFAKVPCVIIDGETTTEELKAYVALSNVKAGRWDYEKLEKWDVDDIDKMCVAFADKAVGMDGFFDALQEKTEEVIQEEKVTVLVPPQFSDCVEEIKGIIEDAIFAEFPNCIVKVK